ncbi:MAG: 5'-methylthioadenosine/S-adenosylhomocysteine nucleosidase [Bowdeniella nasicola]|nr:5'-methylthioadenosine/S-adenosylhomocysteine nucleosidase [Bowdeniella nasicola]
MTPCAYPRVLIITAMVEEARAFLPEGTAGPAAFPLGSWRQVETADVSLAGHTARLAVCGIGSVNAAACTTRLIGEYSPDLVISAGSAGGLGAEVAVGDVVVGSHYRYHSADATAFGYALGQIPGMPERYEAAASPLAEVEGAPGTVRVGEILSGDSFIAAHLVAEVRAAFPEALATDMESAPIAQACHLAGVPFLSVRGISDLCDASAADSFHMAVEQVADRSRAVITHLLAAMN